MPDAFDEMLATLCSTPAHEYLQQLGSVPQASKKSPRVPQKPPFLRGPIPWNWLVQATRHSLNALAVGILLWREVGLRKSRIVPFTLARAEGFQLSPKMTRRGLRGLVEAGLVRVERPVGRALRITVLDVPSSDARVSAHGQVSDDRQP